MPDRAGGPPPRRVVLVGFMGSGKTSVGRELAALLGWSFLDLDELVERRAGRTIAAIFRESGEPAFRAEEREAARAAGGRADCVIAAGGGAFVEPETQKLLRNGALSVYLECRLETILRRVPADGSRPLAGNRETMARLLLARGPCYGSADLAVDANDATPYELALKIAQALGTARSGRASGR